MSIETTARELMEAMQPKKAPSAYDTQATVTRVDGDTLWVHIPGGVDETPIQRTINASEGDVVQVRVSNGNAFAIGNASAPPTDDRAANAARAVADTGLAQANEAIEQVDILRLVVEELVASQIETKFIRSPDYSATVIPLIYPSSDLYPEDSLYPSNGVQVITGFAIDLEHGVIYGGFYSEQIVALEARVNALENALTYPKANPALASASAAILTAGLGTATLLGTAGLTDTDIMTEEDI